MNKLREAEILLNQGANVSEASRKIGITEQTYYRWRKEYGGMRIEQAQAPQGVRAGKLSLEAAGSRHFPGQCHFKRSRGGKLLSPSKRRKSVLCVQSTQSDQEDPAAHTTYHG